MHIYNQHLSHWTGPKHYCFFSCKKDTCDTAFEFTRKQGTVSLKQQQTLSWNWKLYQESQYWSRELKTFQPPLTEPVVERPFLNIQVAKTIQLVETGPFYDICKS